MPDPRVINTDLLRNALIDLLRDANFSLPPPVMKAMERMKERESAPLARMTLDILLENARIAEAEQLPLCQDCGAVLVFLEIGQDVSLEGRPLADAINSGVEEAYKKFYLRKSLVSDPLRRVNTGTNTPAFIHCDVVTGDRIKMTAYVKGGGSENMTALKMFRPTDPAEEIIDFIEEWVISAGPNPCPPLFLGVGIGGTADTALVNAKKAVFRGIPSTHPDPWYAEFEDRILDRLNRTGVGPLGFGGRSTAAAVFIKEAPAHIASLPVALNLNCHSFRYRDIVI
jgi:fumarate hydratase subunit alpha